MKNVHFIRAKNGEIKVAKDIEMNYLKDDGTYEILYPSINQENIKSYIDSQMNNYIKIPEYKIGGNLQLYATVYYEGSSGTLTVPANGLGDEMFIVFYFPMLYGSYSSCQNVWFLGRQGSDGMIPGHQITSGDTIETIYYCNCSHLLNSIEFSNFNVEYMYFLIFLIN